MAISRHALQNLVTVIQRRGHQIGGFVGRVTEHDSLIACAFVLVATGINALGKVRGLAVQIVHECQGFMMETGLLIANFFDRAADCGFDFFLGTGRPFAVFIHAFAADFTGEDDQLRGSQRFASDARFGVFRQEEIDDGVADLVRHLVGMTLGNGFRGKKVIVAHGLSSLLAVSAYKEIFISMRALAGNTAADKRQECQRDEQCSKAERQDVAVTREESGGFGHGQERVDAASLA